MKNMFQVTDTTVVWFCISVLFFVISIVYCGCRRVKSRGVSFKAALISMWTDLITDESSEDYAHSALALLTAAVLVIWSWMKRFALALWEYLKPTPGKHIFTPDLYDALYCAVKDYIYAPFQPTITVTYAPWPSEVYVSFYTKSAITGEVAAEVVWHIQAAFQSYLTTYGLTFDYTAIPYVQDNYIEVCLYYAEMPAEYPAYRAACRQSMLMKADPAFHPLLESDVPPSADVVLGYRYEPWRDSGQIVPIAWDMATAPHCLISGPTGGGKTVFAKVLLERLLLSGATVTVCDFKGYGDLKGFVKDYAAGNDCDAALTAFCDAFERDREAGVQQKPRRVLIFDEFGSYSASKSKKETDDLMRRISNLIFLSRAYGYSIIFMAQRFDADVLKTSLRDQFGVKVYMGSSISQQAAMMLFPNSDLDKSVRLQPFCGFYGTPKTDCDVLITPKVDIPALDRRLKALGKANGG